MNLEVAIVFTVGSIAGSIIVSQIWQNNWFKKENFKIQKSAMMAENRIKIKKLERELGLNSKSRSSASSEMQETGSWIDILQNLDSGKIKALANAFSDSPDNDFDEAPGGELDGIMGFVKENPDLVNNFLEGINKGKENTQQARIESRSAY